MWLIDLEAPPPRLRGLLARWGIEVRAGLYVGSATGKAREALWDLVIKELSAGASAVMVFDSRHPQGFDVRTFGPNRREVLDVDGLWLARFTPVEPDERPEFPPLEDADELEFHLRYDTGE